MKMNKILSHRISCEFCYDLHVKMIEIFDTLHVIRHLNKNVGPFHLIKSDKCF